MKFKFNIDDKVRIVRKITKQEAEEWSNGWVSEMDDCVGKIGIIMQRNIWDLDGQCVEEYEIEVGYESWWYPIWVLEPEIRIGEQLQFSFMD